MPKPKISAHAAVKNESNWIWYSLNSVLDYVDEILVTDTGSTDNTPQIIKSISASKLQILPPQNINDETGLSRVRQNMLDRTVADWLMILDGDEVWPDQPLKIITEFIAALGHDYDSLVIPTLNCVGDVYHISPPQSGRYQIAGRTGHYNLRFINLNRVKGLHVDNPQGKLQSYQDEHGVRVQDRDPRHIAFLDAPYLHLTHLNRSSKRSDETNVFWRASKKKTVLGTPLKPDFAYPRSFYFPSPALVPSPWKSRSLSYFIKAALLALPRFIKHLAYG